MAPLPRDLIRWMQTLSLPFSVRQPKRDLANGYLFAEICARYWPSDVELHMYENKCSLKNKESNWKALRKVFWARNVPVSEADIRDCIDMKDGVAIQILETVYTATTDRVIQKAPPPDDVPVVAQIPTFIRSTSTTQGGMVAPTPAVTETKEKEAASPTAAVASPTKEPASPKKGPRAPKPRPPQKSGAIKAVSAEEASETQEKPVQFIQPVVKALAPQTLHRIGHASEGSRGGASESKTASAGLGTEREALEAISDQLETLLIETGTPAWSLTGSVSTNAEYFRKNRAYLSPSLRNIIWSRLLANVDETAAWLLAQPSDFGAFLDFNEGAFVNSNGDNDKAKLYLATTLATMSQRSAHGTIALVNSTLLPAVVPILRTGVQESRQRVASVLRAASLDAGAAYSVLGLLSEALQKQPAGADFEKAAAPSYFDTSALFVMTIQSFFEAVATTSTAASKLRGPAADIAAHDNSTTGTASVGDTTLAAQLIPLMQYNATAGLASSNTLTRAAALRLHVALVRKQGIACVNDGLLAKVEAILLRQPNADAGNDAVCQAFAYVAASLRAIANTHQPSEDEDEEPESTTDPETGRKIATLLNIVARLCSTDFLAAPGGFSSLLQQHLLKEIGSVLPVLPVLMVMVGRQVTDADVITDSFLECVFAMSDSRRTNLLNTAPPMEASKSKTGGSGAGWKYQHRLGSPLTANDVADGAVSGYSLTGAVNDWVPLPVIAALIRRFPSAGKSSSAGGSNEQPEANAELLHWMATFVVGREQMKALCQQEEDLPKWWDLMRAVVPDIEAAVYRAEIAQQRVQGGSDVTDEHTAAIQLGELAAGLINRFYLHLSGVPVSASTMSAEEDANTEQQSSTSNQLTLKATEWFRNVVVASE